MSDEEPEEYEFKLDAGQLPGKLRANPGNPSAVAQEFLAEWNGLRCVWRGEFYQHDGSRWVHQHIDDLMREVNDELMWSIYSTIDAKGSERLLAWSPKNESLANLKTQLKLQAARPTTDEPVGGGDIIYLKDCRYSVVTGGMLEPDPKDFNLHASPVPYDSSAKCPEFDRFLNTMFAGDEVAIEIHLRWMAVELMRYTKLQKGYYLLGQPRSGKGTGFRINNALIGRSQATPVQLKNFADEFGLANAIGKSVIRVHDARNIAPRESAQVAQRLLTIIGGDDIQINKKGADQWTGAPNVLVTIDSNSILSLVDSSTTIATRFIINRTCGSHLGSEDLGLADRIISREMSGVLNRVLVFVDALDEVWPISAAAMEVRQEMMDTANPLLVWMREVDMQYGGDFSATKDDLYSSYVEWSGDQGVKWRMTKDVMVKNLLGCLRNQGVRFQEWQPKIAGKQVRSVKGIGIPGI